MGDDHVNENNKPKKQTDVQNETTTVNLRLRTTEDMVAESKGGEGKGGDHLGWVMTTSIT